MADYLNKLNPQQLDAVRTTEGAIRVLAGSGTIIAVNMQESSYSILFDSLKTERNIQFSAKIEKAE